MNDIPVRSNKSLLVVHGGAFVMFGDGHYAKALAAVWSNLGQCTAYSVNYRLPPDYRFPTPVDDVVAVYKTLLETYEPRDIALCGESAGGNLAAAACLKIRDSGLPLPGAAVLLSPAVDLTEAGDSYTMNVGIDAALKSHPTEAIALYADGHDLRHPYLSPIFADFSTGFPPTFIQSGTRDILLSGAVVLHRALRRADIDAELHIWEGMAHGNFVPGSIEVPEDREMNVEINRFLLRH